MRYKPTHIRKRLFAITLLSLLAFMLSISAMASNGNTIVYITDTGKKYHSAGCSYLSESCNAITLSEAVNSGKTPCSRCNPPILNSDYDANNFPDNPGSSSNNTTTGEPYTVEDVLRIIANSDQISESKKSAYLKEYAELHQDNAINSEKWAPNSEQTVYLEDDIFHLKGCPGIQGNGTLRSLSFLTKDVQPCNYCQPLKYTSMKDVPGYVEPKEENNFSDFFVYSIFPCIITAMISFKIGRTNDYSKKLEQINGKFYDRFHHINNPKTGKPITDAESYLEALKAQEEINKSK